MPLLYHETNLRSRIPSISLPSWWRQKVSKYNGKNNNNNNDDITTGTTRDWRSLSPNNPPLPFVQENDHNGTTSDIYPYTQASERAPKRFPIPNKYRHSSYDDGQLQKLSTIIEESDLLTEISLSPKNSSNYHHHHHHRQRQQESGFITQNNHDKNDDITVIPSPALPPNNSPHPSSTGSTSPNLPPLPLPLPLPPPLNDTVSSFIESTSPAPSSSSLTSPLPSSNDSTDRPTTITPTALSSSLSSSDTSSLSSSSLSPLSSVVWPTHAMKILDTHYIPTTPEAKVKEEFISIIQWTYTFRQEHQLLFDTQDNRHKLQIWMHDPVQCHIFRGEAQSIPPELLTRCRMTYDCDKVDVWILGISLYRMLIGKYPFQANTGYQLSSSSPSNIHRTDLSIPPHLSADAKDLLRRMLAPYHSRASLDLVMFHPWLKPYSMTIPAPLYDTMEWINQSSPPSPSIETTTTIAPPRAIQDLGLAGTTTSPLPPSTVRSPLPPPPPPVKDYPTPIPKNQRKSMVSKLKKAFVFIVQGPCPPPSHPYRDLSLSTSF